MCFDQLLQGNDGISEDHTIWFDPAINTRYVRLNPQDWFIKPCLRVEAFGCDALGKCRRRQPKEIITHW